MANIAVAWLLEKDWPAWCALDDQLPPYARWPSKISTAIEDAERTGVKSEKIEIDPQIFFGLVRLDRKQGHESRALYAAEVLMKRISLQ